MHFPFIFFNVALKHICLDYWVVGNPLKFWPWGRSLTQFTLLPALAVNSGSFFFFFLARVFSVEKRGQMSDFRDLSVNGREWENETITHRLQFWEVQKSKGKDETIDIKGSARSTENHTRSPFHSLAHLLLGLSLRPMFSHLKKCGKASFSHVCSQ